MKLNLVSLGFRTGVPNYFVTANCLAGNINCTQFITGHLIVSMILKIQINVVMLFNFLSLCLHMSHFPIKFTKKQC